MALSYKDMSIEERAKNDSMKWVGPPGSGYVVWASDNTRIPEEEWEKYLLSMLKDEPLSEEKVETPIEEKSGEVLSKERADIYENIEGVDPTILGYDDKVKVLELLDSVGGYVEKDRLGVADKIERYEDSIAAYKDFVSGDIASRVGYDLGQQIFEGDKPSGVYFGDTRISDMPALNQKILSSVPISSALRPGDMFSSDALPLMGMDALYGSKSILGGLTNLIGEAIGMDVTPEGLESENIQKYYKDRGYKGNPILDIDKPLWEFLGLEDPGFTF